MRRAVVAPPPQRWRREPFEASTLLLGLVRGTEGMVARVLVNLDVDRERLRGEVVRATSAAPDIQSRARPHHGAGVAHSALGPVRVELGSDAQRLMRATAARALDDQRLTVEPRDFVAALLGDVSASTLLSQLGVDVEAARPRASGSGGASRAPSEER